MEDEKTKTKKTYISVLALTMMNVSMVAGLANDVQQSFYGLASVTYFAIGAICFFIPTALVAAELASGWSNRGGIFRWVGEGLGKGWGLTCLFILWFQTMLNFGMGMPSFTATIMFYTPNYDAAVKFAQNPQHELLIMTGWIILYWVLAYLATKGVKTFSNLAKYGVIIGSLIPLAVMVILAIVWVAQGHTPAIPMTPKDLIPKWNGMSTLALAAGVFFSYTGIDMNAAHIKQLKHPEKDFTKAMFISIILAFLIFVVGTVIIAMIIPEKQINVLYTLYSVFRILGSTIGMPWLYMVLVWALLCNTIAMVVTNMAGPSFMLGQAGGSGFLPHWLQEKNKHNMPAHLMYTQIAGMTIIAYLVKLIPNVEGFVILLTQTITVLYMIYYILMFTAFLRLRYDQPNRPRSFKVPGGMVGAWIVAGIGLISSVFAIVLAIYPPAQVKSEVGSPAIYISVIVILVAIILAICLALYQLSKHHDWVNPDNEFAPFTWEIEGLKKPGKVLSNVPTTLMSKDQNPMGMPIKRPYKPDQQVSEHVVKADEENNISTGKN
ncbi:MULTISPECIES: APC family permease [Lactobacillus]|jgi:amino acid transporter|uniref:APC family permease n=1 Tax=Lactobacillus paragasseri TaxID=2107999 RepID=A0AAW6XJF6_9LACO|nr:MULTISPECIES: APC family permease [Lactobacillus]MCZ3508179.1 APC family permease [Lactobacillus gasseri]MDK6867677.1 APC family permease [Lactobacillus paragasseri]MDK7952426.1 APC family permease [Lactobacillus paragasseri]MDO6361081.1 APC family permease [Lactobacillus paragasseri]MDX5058952.1 APC family permease [Lactobacillus paragasseri]